MKETLLLKNGRKSRVAEFDDGSTMSCFHTNDDKNLAVCQVSGGYVVFNEAKEQVFAGTVVDCLAWVHNHK